MILDTLDLSISCFLLSASSDHSVLSGDRQDGMNVKTALNQHVRSPSPLCHGFRSREAGSMHVDFQDRGFVAFVDPGITSHYEFEIQSDSGI